MLGISRIGCLIIIFDMFGENRFLATSENEARFIVRTSTHLQIEQAGCAILALNMLNPWSNKWWVLTRPERYGFPLVTHYLYRHFLLSFHINGVALHTKTGRSYPIARKKGRIFHGKPYLKWSLGQSLISIACELG